jgi:hypothetical protein
MEALLEERAKRTHQQSAKEEGSLENLVASVKRKSKAILDDRERKKRRA